MNIIHCMIITLTFKKEYHGNKNNRDKYQNNSCKYNAYKSSPEMPKYILIIFKIWAHQFSGFL